MAPDAAPLLEKVYFEKCPGCQNDRRKEANTGIPYKEFFYVWIITLCTALPISSLFPYVYFLIRDLHVAKREEDIGFYAGFVGASFMLGRALTSLFWGIVADRHGRKPVIVVSIAAVIIFNTLFGLSTTYWMAITTRFLLGSLNGLLGPIKAYSMEVSSKEYQALGLSLVTTAWGIGLIIGPAMGGYLAQPAEKYPEIFSQDSFFGRFPYFLPCLCISVFAVGVFIASLWLPETLHKHDPEQIGDATFKDVETPPNISGTKRYIEENVGRESPPKENLFKNWPLMSSVIVYCIASLHDMAYTEIFSLWAVSDKSYGGLSFSTQEVGQVLAISGVGLLLYQILFYPKIERVMGPVSLLQVSTALSIPLLVAYPYMTNLSGLGLTVAVNCASLLKNVLSVSIVIGCFILQNNAVPQEQRGAANGISMTAMSFFKSVAPAAAGVIFSWAQKRQHASFLPGDLMIFFTLNVVLLALLLLSFKPFLVQAKTG